MTNQLPDAEAALLAATTSTSPTTPVPEKNKTEHCLSCGAATPKLYCGECGLKNDDLRRSLPKLIAETLGGIFSFEGRMWRTWAALIFKPGKVAREYSDGKRTTYSAPIRVYLVMTFLLLSYLAVTQTNLFAVVVTPKTPEQIAAAIENNEDGDSFSIRTPGSTKSIQELSTTVIDAAKTDDQEALEEAFEDLGDTEFKFELNDYNFDFLFFQPQSKFDALSDTKSVEGFVNTMNAEDVANVEGNQAALEDETRIREFAKVFLTQPTQFNQQFNVWLPRAMFFMVPMVMFLGVIYIRGPNALMYDHLIHAIYIHSVFFMGLLFAILLSKIMDGGTIARILFIGLLLYLPISLKRMFGRGWLKTIWTTMNIGFIYMLMLTFVMVIITVYSLDKLAA